MTSPYEIVIPTFRRTASLARLLRAIAAQQHRPANVVVVDQNAPGVIGQFLEGSGLSLEIVRLAQPNCSTARNVGFARTRAPIVIFLDDDLEPGPDFAENMTSRLGIPEVGVCAPVVDGTIESAEGSLRAFRARALSVHPRNQALLRVRTTLSAALGFRRDAFVATGGFDEGLFEFARSGEDHELFARMSTRQIPLWIATDVLVRHHDDEGGGAEMRTSGATVSRERRLRAWAYKACAHGGGSPDAIQLAYLARMVLVNRRALTQNPLHTLADIRDLARAIQASRTALATGNHPFGRPRSVSHLQSLRENSLD